MNDESLLEMIKKYGLKILSFTFGAFFIVWLSQYLYDVWKISEVYGNIGNRIKGIFQALEDIRYKTAVNTNSADFHFLLVQFFFSFSFGFSISYVFKFIKQKKNFRAVISLLLSIIIGMGAFDAGKTETLINRISVKSPNNLIIIKPYISAEEYSILQSEYYQIDSKADFENHNKKVERIAKKHDLTINLFD